MERVVEQAPIVGTDIEYERQAVLRRHAGASRIEGELADRYAHPAGTEIARPEDALAVCNDNEAHVLLGPVAKDFSEPAARGDRQKHASGRAKNMREFLACLADRRRVDERHVGGRVRHQDRVEQSLVARPQVR
jgi:hypothetical protein